ncbi:MAG: hypothetical protein HFJ00_12690 [Lachnospiraceae bacterium]|nr:hypothetical protein [Lachnospiraceae bacterium]
MMQIQGDYHPHSGHGYEPPHTHYITKCLHEEEHTKNQTGAAGIKSRAISSPASEESAGGESFTGYGSVRRRSGAKGGRPGLIRGFWESLGEEKEDGKSKESIYAARDGGKKDSETSIAGISAVSAALGQLIPAAAITRIGNVRERLKAGIGTALKGFGKREDDLGTLSNPGSYFEGKRRGKDALPGKQERGTRQADREIITATVSDSYLMDSYSKSGRYCRLNENMIYQKNQDGREEEEEAF